DIHCRLQSLANARAKNRETQITTGRIEGPGQRGVAVKNDPLADSIAGLRENSRRGSQNEHTPARCKPICVGNHNLSIANFRLRRYEEVDAIWRYEKDLGRASIYCDGGAGDVRGKHAVFRLL